MLSKIWVRDPGSEIRDPEKPIPDPGSRVQTGTGSRIRIPDPQHCPLPNLSQRTYSTYRYGTSHCKNKCLPNLIVKYLETAARRDLADGGGVEAVVIVAVPGLDKDGGIRQALRVHFPAHVV
jgi:hypothetical protein